MESDDAFDYWINLMEKEIEFESSIRCPILIQYISIEQMVGDIIGLFFIHKGDRRQYFSSQFIDTMSMVRKTQILNNIMSDYYSPFYLENKHLIKQLNDMRDLRNRVTHHISINPPEKETGGEVDKILLVKPKRNSVDIKQLTEEDKRAFSKQYILVMTILMKLLRLITNDILEQDDLEIQEILVL